jgi:hypothetical protein
MVPKLCNEKSESLHAVRCGNFTISGLIGSHLLSSTKATQFRTRYELQAVPKMKLPAGRLLVDNFISSRLI